MRIALSLKFAARYIAHPYWPAREKVISIQKISGINRVRSVEKRDRALDAYLHTIDTTREQYDALVTQADRQFYTWADVLTRSQMDGKKPDEIVIPAHQMYGCLAQAAAMAPASMRLARVEQLRVVLRLSDGFATGKLKADGIFSRYVVVKLGTGVKASNQRSLRENAYIEDFDATGALDYLPGEDERDEKKVRDFIEFAGREIGVGASRKVGSGRFEISGWQRLAERKR